MRSGRPADPDPGSCQSYPNRSVQHAGGVGVKPSHDLLKILFVDRPRQVLFHEAFLVFSSTREAYERQIQDHALISCEFDGKQVALIKHMV